jgi:hypothetical protein
MLPQRSPSSAGVRETTDECASSEVTPRADEGTDVGPLAANVLRALFELRQRDAHVRIEEESGERERLSPESGIRELIPSAHELEGWFEALGDFAPASSRADCPDCPDRAADEDVEHAEPSERPKDVEAEPVPPPASDVVVPAIPIPRARSVTLVMPDRPIRLLRPRRPLRPLAQPVVRPAAPSPVAPVRRRRWPVAAAIGMLLTAAVGCFFAARTSSDYGWRWQHVTHAAQR